MKHIILIGFMGSGKTTIGTELARVMHAEFLDTDAWIEERQQRKISDIFDTYGEEYFRNLETEMLKELLERKEQTVISVGGGLPVREENQFYLKQLGKVIYLTANVDTLTARLEGDTTRPMLKGADLSVRIRNLMEERGAIYEQTADVQIATDNKEIEELAEEIEKYVRENTEAV